MSALRQASIQFNFLQQTGRVMDLLDAAAAAIPFLPEDKARQLEGALREFEHRAAVTLWSVEDISSEEYGACSAAEKHRAIERMVDDYECSDSEWSDLFNCMDEVIKRRGDQERFLKVIKADGSNSYVPVRAVEAYLREEGGSIHEAVNHQLGLALDTFISVEPGHHYDAEGKLIE